LRLLPVFACVSAISEQFDTQGETESLVYPLNTFPTQDAVPKPSIRVLEIITKYGNQPADSSFPKMQCAKPIHNAMHFKLSLDVSNIDFLLSA